MASFYQGTEVGTILKTVKGSRYFYGLRRTQDGVIFGKIRPNEKFRRSAT